MSGSSAWLSVLAFPFPIAHACCAIEAESERRPERRFFHLMYALEGLLQLLGAVVLVDAWEASTQPGTEALTKALRRTRLDRGSLGLWAHALTEILPMIPEPFMPEMQSASRELSFRDLLEQLVQGRNDLAHPFRPIARNDALEQLPRVREQFEALCGHLEFLATYHLLGVRDDQQRLARGHQISVVSLSGRNPSWRAVPLDVSQLFDTGDVILVNPSGESALVLRPFYRMPDDEADHDVLAYKGTVEPGALEYYHCAATSRHPVQTTLTIPGSKGGPRGVDPGHWLASRDRPPLRVPFLSSATSCLWTPEPSDVLARIERTTDAPLRDLRPFRLGGMAEIFIGIDPVLSQPRILKVPKARLDPTQRKKFLHEGMLLARINHPSVIRVYAASLLPLVGPCIIEEYFAAPTLQEHLDLAGPFDIDDSKLIIDRLLDGLVALHTSHVVHRDLKPANVLFDRTTQGLKIIDLGIARDLEGPRHGTTQYSAGTVEYMAPEQAESGEITAATDVFAVALIYHALLCGVAPRRIRLIPEIRDDRIPAHLKVILVKATQYRPEDRFDGASELLSALRAVGSGSSVPGSDVAPGEPLTERSLSRLRLRLADARLRFSGDVSSACELQIAAIQTIRSNLGHFDDQAQVTGDLQAALDELQAQVGLAERVFRAEVVAAVDETGAGLVGGRPDATEIQGVLHALTATPIAAFSVRDAAVISAAAGSGVAMIGAMGLLPVVGVVAGAASFVLMGAFAKKAKRERVCDATIGALEQSRAALIDAAGAWIKRLLLEVENVATSGLPAGPAD